MSHTYKTFGGDHITARALKSSNLTFQSVILVITLLLGQTITLANQSTVDNIRVHHFKSKTRIVLDFSFKPKTIIIDELTTKSSILKLHNTGLSKSVDPSIELNTSTYTTIKENNSELQVELPVSIKKIKTFTINSPDRLIIDLEGITQPGTQIVNSVKTKRTNGEIYPGVNHKTYYLNGPVIVNVIDIDLNNPSIDINFASANKNTLFSKKNINQIVKQEEAIAGINASFFKPPSGLPLGTLIVNNEILTGPIFNRVSLVIDDYNKGTIEPIKLNSYCVIKNKTRLNIQNINQPRLGVDGVMMYTDLWKSYVPKTLRNELQVVIKDGKVVKKTTGSISVPEKSIVITGPNKDDLKALEIGDSVKIELGYTSSKTKIKHAIGGGPYLIRNGEVYIDCKAQNFSFNPSAREPRTAVGLTRSNHLLLVTADGRQNRSIGMSFYQLANFLKSLGAVQAMNFDGGSSTQMSINGFTVNKPTVQGGALVSTGIVVKPAYDIELANQIP